MNKLDQLTTSLVDLCFGQREPLARLLKDGCLPDRWAEDVLDLLTEIRPMVAADTAVPAKLMVCIHFAAIYPWLRYLAWAHGPRRDDKTRRSLGLVASACELLLMNLANSELAASGAKLAEAGPLRGYGADGARPDDKSRS